VTTILSDDAPNSDCSPPQAGDLWPTCPRCGRRRLASCPACHTSDTQFPLADQDYAGRLLDGAENPFVVTCHICDEAWSPHFPQVCEWCGHHFGDGHPSNPADARSPDPITPRVILVAMGLVTLFFAMVAYFALIAR